MAAAPNPMPFSTPNRDDGRSPNSPSDALEHLSLNTPKSGAPTGHDKWRYQVKDIQLAKAGRLEIQMAEADMPGLIACRQEYAHQAPLVGARVTGCIHLTAQTAVLLETLQLLGAKVQWCSSNIFSTNDAVAAAVAEETGPVFAWKGETLEEYWWCIDQALTWMEADGSALGPHILIDDGGDATLLLHEGFEAETKFTKGGHLPDPSKTSNPEYSIVLQLIALSLQRQPTRWSSTIAGMAGVSEETASGVKRLYELQTSRRLKVPALNTFDSVTKTKFDNTYGCMHSVVNAIYKAMDYVLLAGKTAFVAGYGDVGKGVSTALRAASARVVVSEVDPICALQAMMAGFQVVTLEDVVESADIFITCTGSCDIILVDHMAHMKTGAIIANIGHFDGEIDVHGLSQATNITRQNIKPQVDRYQFADGHWVILLAEGRLVNFGCTSGHPSFAMSCIFTNQVMAVLELYHGRQLGLYKPGLVYIMPRVLDEKVASLHVSQLGGRLTKLTPKQSACTHVPIPGPYKPIRYRY